MQRKPLLAACLAIAALASATVFAAETSGPITAEQARSIALTQTGGGQVMEVDRHYGGDGHYYFRVEVVGDQGAYHLEIDADSGRLLQFIRKHGPKLRGARLREGTLPPAMAGAYLTYEQAQEYALQLTGGGVVVESDMDVKRSGRIKYEFEIINQGVKYEIEMDGTGAILDFERNGRNIRPPAIQPPSTAPSAMVQPTERPAPAPTAPATTGTGLDLAAAQAKALEQTGGGTVVEYKRETSNGRPVHDFVIDRNNRRHTVEVDDQTGAVRELSVRDLNQ